MSLTFFGGLPGAPPRVTLIPSPIASTEPPDCRAAWASAGSIFAALPAVSQRAWWWFALSLISKSDRVSSCLLRFAPTRGHAHAPHRHWIDFVEHTAAIDRGIDHVRLLQWSSAILGTPNPQWRTCGIRFGVASDGSSDLSFGVDPTAIPGLIMDWRDYVAAHTGSADAALVAFRQLVLIHPLHDGNGRLARIVVAHLTRAAGLPSLIMMPALAMYRARSDIDRAAYSAAISCSDPQRFNRFVLERTMLLSSALRLHDDVFRRAEDDFRPLTIEGSFPSMIRRRLMTWPVVSVEALAKSTHCSLRNAHRWCETYAGRSGFEFDGAQLIWRSLLDQLDVIEPLFWSVPEQ